MMGRCIVAGGNPDMAAPVTDILASDLAVGSTVKLMEGGVAVEYLVVNQGKPSGSSLYDDSCDGLWLLRKDIIEKRAWETDIVNKLESSDIHSWLNYTMLAKYDTNIQKAIKQVKIPYRKNGGSDGSNQDGANGLSCKVFLLSGYEVGWNTRTNSYFPLDGAVLDYFKGTASTDAKRISYLNGTATSWWLRSPYTKNTFNVFHVFYDGDYSHDGSNYSCGVRPALVLPSDALFNKNTLIFKGVA